MYNTGQPNNYYPDRHRSQERGGIFSNAGRAMFAHDNLSQPEIYPMNPRNSVNGYPAIDDLRRPSIERRTREPSRANSVSNSVKMEERRSKKYDSMLGMGEHALLDEYAGLNNLEDQLGSGFKGPISGRSTGIDHFDQVPRGLSPDRGADYLSTVARGPISGIGYPIERYNEVQKNHYVPNHVPSHVPNTLPVHMNKLKIPTSLPSIQRSQIVHSHDNRESNLNYYKQQNNLYDEPISYIHEGPRPRHYESLTYREFEDKLKQYNKDNKLRIKLLKQNQKIEMLMQNQMRSNSQVDLMNSGGNAYPYRPYMDDQMQNRLYADLLAQQKVWSQDMKKLKKMIKKSTEKEPEKEHENKNSNNNAFSLAALLKQKLSKDKDKDKTKKNYTDGSLENIVIKKNNKKSPKNKDKVKNKSKNAPKDKDKSQDSLATKIVINKDGQLELEPDEEPDEEPDKEPDEDPDDREAELRAIKKAKSNLRKVLWALLYPSLLENDIIRKILTKKDKQLKNLVETQNNAIKSLAAWMYDLVEGSISPIFADKNLSYDFIGIDPLKKVSDQTKKTRARIVQFKLITLFEDLIAKTKTQPMQSVDLEYLASISQKEIYAQSNMFTIYEIMRLTFSTYGRIIKLTKEQSQMILAVCLLMRILIYKIMLGVKGWYQNVVTNQSLLNFQILGSVLYRIVHNIWTKLNDIINRDPSKIPLVPVRPLVVDLNIPGEDTKADDQEVIVGTFSKQQLGLIIYNNDEWITAMNNLIIQWIDEIYKKVVAYRKINPQSKIV